MESHMEDVEVREKQMQGAGQWTKPEPTEETPTDPKRLGC